MYQLTLKIKGETKFINIKGAANAMQLKTLLISKGYVVTTIIRGL